MEFKPDDPRDVTGYDQALGDIVLPNEDVRQVVNRTKPTRGSQGKTYQDTRTTGRPYFSVRRGA